MAEAIRHIATSRANAFAPGVVREAPGKMDIGAASAHSTIRDAGKIGLAADARAESAVQRVVPDVQLEDEGRVSRGNEVDGVMRNVDDVLVCTDAVEDRHFVVRQLARLHLKAQSGMRESGDGPLRLRPLQDRQVPGGPVLDLADAR